MTPALDMTRRNSDTSQRGVGARDPANENDEPIGPAVLRDIAREESWARCDSSRERERERSPTGDRLPPAMAQPT